MSMQGADTPKAPLSKMPQVGTTIFTEMSALASVCGALNVAQGFPDLETPLALRQAVTDAIEAGHNQYAPMPGNAVLRRWLADVWHKGAGYDPETEITIGAGASSVIFAAMTALLHPGDEVVLSTSKGTILRQRIDEVSVQARSATGVLVQKLTKDDSIVDISIVPPDSIEKGSGPV